MTDGRGAARWRWVAYAVVVGFVATFLVANRSELPGAWRAARGADPAWLAVAGLAAVAWVLDHAAMHTATQWAVGLPARPAPLVPVVLGSTFLNTVTKSGGMAGVVLFTADGRRRGLARGPVVAAYVLASVVSEIGFALVLVAALVVVWADGRLSGAEVAASIAFAAYLVVRLGVVVTAARSRAAVRRLYALPGRVTARVRRRPAPAVDHTAADELADAAALLRSSPARCLPALAFAVALELVGVAMLWAVLEALGARPSVAVPFVAYAVSVLFVIVGVLPGGLGLVEVSMGAVLTSFGVPVARATAAVAVYRIFELWLPIGIGALAAHRVRRGAAVPA